MAHGLQNHAHGTNWRLELSPGLLKNYQNTPLLTLQQYQAPFKLIAIIHATDGMLSGRASENATEVQEPVQEDMNQITGEAGTDMVEISVDETTRVPNGKLPEEHLEAALELAMVQATGK
jgi:hypothetical protein